MQEQAARRLAPAAPCQSFGKFFIAAAPASRSGAHRPGCRRSASCVSSRRVQWLNDASDLMSVALFDKRRLIRQQLKNRADIVRMLESREQQSV
jgi:hypothetical protein